MSTPNDKRVISRRALLEGAAAACAVTVAAPFINRGRYRLFAYSEAEYSARAIALVQRSTIVDMLCILNMNFAQADKWMANPETFTDKDFMLGLASAQTTLGALGQLTGATVKR